MALSYETYTASGGTTQFDLPFGYLRRSHIFVFVDGTLHSYKWVSPTRVEIPPSDVETREVTVRRLTDKVRRITDFADGQTLLAGDLDAATLQNFYIVQEMIDQLTDGVLNSEISVSNPLDQPWYDENGLPTSPTLQWMQEQVEEATRTSPVIQQLLGQSTVNEDAIIAETQARLAALQAETEARVAAIQAEAQARQDALNAEQAARLAQVAGIQTQIDADVLALNAEQAARLAQVSNLQTQIDADVLALNAEVDSRLADVAGLQTQIDATTSNLQTQITTEQALRTDGDTQLAQTLSLIGAANATGTAFIFDLNTAQVAGGVSLTQRLSSLQSDIGGNNARIIQEETTRSDADSALASTLSLIGAESPDGLAFILDASTAQVEAGVSLSQRLSSLQSEIDGNSAQITSEATTRSNADSALASTLSLIGAETPDGLAFIFDSNKAKVSPTETLAQRLSGLQSGIDGANSAITSEQQVRVNADQALAGDISALQTRMGGAEAGVLSNSEAISTETSARASEFNSLTAKLEAPGVNLVVNPTFREGVDYWSQGGNVTWTPHLFPQRRHLVASGLLTGLSGRSGNLISDPISVPSWGSNGVQVTLSALVEVYGLVSGLASLSVQCLNDSGGWVGSAVWINVGAGPNGRHVQTGTLPAGTAAVQVVMSLDNCAFDSNYGEVFLRQVKLETGGVATQFRDDATAEATVRRERQARVDADSAQASDISALGTRMGTAEAGITSNQTAISTETSARASAVSGLQAQIDGANAAITSEQQVRASADSSMASSITSLHLRTISAEADIVYYGGVISDESSTRATQFNSLQAQINDADAAVLSEQSARISADQAVATDVSALQTRMGTAETNIVNVQGAVSTESSARASDINVLEAFLRPNENLFPDPSGANGGVAWSGMADAYVSDWNRQTRYIVRYQGRPAGTNHRWVDIPVNNANRYVHASLWLGAYNCNVRAYIEAVNTAGEWLAGHPVGEVRALESGGYGDAHVSTDGTPGLFAPTGTGFIRFVIEMSNPVATSAQVDALFRRIKVEWDRVSYFTDDRASHLLEAEIVSERQARVDADGAFAQDISGLLTRMGGAESSIESNTQAISTETSALTSDFQSLKAQLGGGGNLLKNPAFLLDGPPNGGLGQPEGWNVYAAGGWGIRAAGRRADIWELKDGASDTWFVQADRNGSSTGYADFASTFEIPVEPGKRYAAQALTGAHRCRAVANIYYLDAAGNWMGLGDNAVSQVNNQEKLGGSTLADWKRVFWVSDAPAGAAKAILAVRNDNWTGQSGDPLLFITRPMLEETRTGVNVPSPWSASGDATSAAFTAQERAARVSADSAQASDISALGTRMGDAEADITTNSTAISDETSARATEVKQLSARLGAASASFPASLGRDQFTSSADGPPETVSNLSQGHFQGPGAEAFGSYFTAPADGSNKYMLVKALIPLVQGRRYKMTVSARYRGADFASLTNPHLETTFWLQGPTHAYVTTAGTKAHRFSNQWGVHQFTTGFVAQDNAAWARPGIALPASGGLTQPVDIIDIRVEEESASMTEVRDVFADSNGDLQALYTLRTDVNGNVAGFGLSNDGSTSSLAILANNFLLVDPNNPTGPGSTPFSVINGNTYIDKAFIGEATISSLMMETGAVGASLRAVDTGAHFITDNNANRAVSQFNTYTISATVDSVLQPGDVVDLEFFYMLTGRMNAAVWFVFHDYIQVSGSGLTTESFRKSNRQWSASTNTGGAAGILGALDRVEGDFVNRARWIVPDPVPSQVTFTAQVRPGLPSWPGTRDCLSAAPATDSLLTDVRYEGMELKMVVTKRGPNEIFTDLNVSDGTGGGSTGGGGTEPGTGGGGSGGGVNP